MSNRIRAFLAVELDEEVRRALEEIQKGLDSRTLDVRWVRPGNLHLTLRFLGEVPEDEIPGIREAAGKTAAETSPFRMTLQGLGAFPSGGRPRVVWIGVREPAPLLEMERRLSRELGLAGLPPPDKPFRPHLTLGRVKDRRGTGRLVDRMRANRDVAAGSVDVTSLALIRSDLRPRGPIYTVLDRFPFPLPPREAGG